MEINEIRPFFKKAFDELRKLKKEGGEDVTADTASTMDLNY